MSRKFTFGLFLLCFVLLFCRCRHSFLDQEINFGIQAAQKDLWDEAIFRWKKAILSNPDSAAAHNNLAVAYEKKGLWDEAQKEYEIALKLSPKDPQIKANYDNFKKTLEPSDKETSEKEKKDEKK